MKATPSNRLLFQLAPSERGTGGTESGLPLMPTPQAMQSPDKTEKVIRLKEQGKPLMSRSEGDNSRQYNMKDWMIYHGMLPTATTRDYKGGRKPETLEESGRTETNSLNDTVNSLEGHTGSLNPNWVEWLMGYPIGWTDLKDSEMQ